jgi:GT2 family glycosyltransferase
MVKLTEPDEPLVSIIILNFNGQNMLRECLQSVFKTKYSNYECIVVDNDSTDDSCTMVEKEFPNVKLIKNLSNLGYSKGNNKGILYSKGDFIVLLNNDVIVTPNWLSELIQVARKNPYCFYQPKIMFSEGNKINSTGNLIQLFGFAFPRGIGETDIGQYDIKYDVSYASGACVLVSRRLVEIVGLLDEDDLFTFYEDVNWGWRGLMHGFRTVYVPSAVVYHRWGGSWGKSLSSSKFFFIERGRLSTVFRNYSFRTLIVLFPMFIIVELLVFIYCLLRGFLPEKIRVYTDLWRFRKLLISQRRELQRRRKVSDAFVINFFSEGLNHIYLGSFAIPINKLLSFLAKIVKPLII